ncbi:TetR/AcrR family transcriptional regulator [Micromonospora rhizosphaerae]|uniref:TetR/AcrR family transcriptional regulator n=1 Tax=Micromonospora rhizosphaerae TaxID=568872 RepID=UPI000B80EF6C|nr:TetR/AcrR family transcriptional regulator [Micromonospora rhizosphaerae]
MLGNEWGEAGMVESQPNQRQGRPVRTRAPQVNLTDSEILQRGLDTFSELGYEGASVRELAKRLGVSHNFINDRFGSKINFCRAVVDHVLEDLMKQLAVAFDVDADDYEKLENIVKTFYSLAANVPQMNRISGRGVCAQLGTPGLYLRQVHSFDAGTNRADRKATDGVGSDAQNTNGHPVHRS